MLIVVTGAAGALTHKLKELSRGEVEFWNPFEIAKGYYPEIPEDISEIVLVDGEMHPWAREKVYNAFPDDVIVRIKDNRQAWKYLAKKGLALEVEPIAKRPGIRPMFPVHDSSNLILKKYNYPSPLEIIELKAKQVTKEIALMNSDRLIRFTKEDEEQKISVITEEALDMQGAYRHYEGHIRQQVRMHWFDYAQVIKEGYLKKHARLERIRSLQRVA